MPRQRFVIIDVKKRAFFAKKLSNNFTKDYKRASQWDSKADVEKALKQILNTSADEKKTKQLVIKEWKPLRKLNLKTSKKDKSQMPGDDELQIPEEDDKLDLISSDDDLTSSDDNLMSNPTSDDDDFIDEDDSWDEEDKSDALDDNNESADDDVPPDTDDSLDLSDDDSQDDFLTDEDETEFVNYCEPIEDEEFDSFIYNKPVEDEANEPQTQEEINLPDYEDFLDQLEKLCFLTINASQIKRQLEKKINESDHKDLDFLHVLELGKFDAAQGSQLLKWEKESRKLRRQYKDELWVISTLFPVTNDRLANNAERCLEILEKIKKNKRLYGFRNKETEEKFGKLLPQNSDVNQNDSNLFPVTKDGLAENAKKCSEILEKIKKNKRLYGFGNEGADEEFGKLLQQNSEVMQNDNEKFREIEYDERFAALMDALEQE